MTDATAATPPAVNDPNIANPEAKEMKPTTSPQKKVIAATGGAAVGSAITTLLVWLLSFAFENQAIPDEVSSALNVIFASILTFVAGYYTPPAASEGSVSASDGSIKAATTG